MALYEEKIILRSENKRPLSIKELDNNFLYVANYWNPRRIYKEGMVVYNNFNGKLRWFRAIEDNGPSLTFDISKWEEIGGGEGSGVLIKFNNNIQNYSGISLSNKFIISNDGSFVHIDIGNLDNIWNDAGNFIKLVENKKIVLGGNDLISSNSLLSIYGLVDVIGNIKVIGNIYLNNIDLNSFINNNNIHTHTIVGSNFPNYNILYPNSRGGLGDVMISNLVDGNVLAWDENLKKWINKNIEIINNLANLEDVLLNNLNNNNLLYYNNGKWKNLNIQLDNNYGFIGFLGHIHHGLYYTKEELMNGSGNLINFNVLYNIPNFSIEGHTHKIKDASDIIFVDNDGIIKYNSIDKKFYIDGLNINFNGLYNVNILNQSINLTSDNAFINWEFDAQGIKLHINYNENDFYINNENKLSILNKEVHKINFSHIGKIANMFIEYGFNRYEYIFLENSILKKIYIRSKNGGYNIKIYKNNSIIYSNIINNLNNGIYNSIINLNIDYLQYDILKIFIEGIGEDIDIECLCINV